MTALSAAMGLVVTELYLGGGDVANIVATSRVMATPRIAIAFFLHRWRQQRMAAAAQLFPIVLPIVALHRFGVWGCDEYCGDMHRL